jgi:hypothetical protein
MGSSRRTRVYVSFHPSTRATARKVRTLLEQLRTALAADRGRSWDVVDPCSIGLDEDVEATRDRLCAEADVRVVLRSSTVPEPWRGSATASSTAAKS